MSHRLNCSALCHPDDRLVFWSFVAASNGILIPFKEKFVLSQTQAQLVDSKCFTPLTLSVRYCI
jgi:hypothetical protein